jgi:hypothetical protein
MTHITKTVATVLEQELIPTIQQWMQCVEEIPELSGISLTYDDRTGHLPQLLKELITRLRLTKGSKRPSTTFAHDHGRVRFEQGYSVVLLVEESRLLQVSIFNTLRRHQKSLDLDRLLPDVITIADECDTQLKHAVETFMELEKHCKHAAA